MTSPTTLHRGRRFDRFPEPSRNAEYPVRRRLEFDGYTTTRSRIEWSLPPIMDQGEDGACVAFAWTHELQATPVRVDLAAAGLPRRWPTEPDPFARRAYFAMQRHDEWEGGEYPGAAPVYAGTSVVAGARTMVRLGLLRSYHWAFTTGDVRDALLRYGPAILGVMWLEGMFEAPGGVVRAEGQEVGGHCVLITGYQPDRDLGGGPEPAFKITNSWGPSYGIDGSAWISEPGLASLLSRQGEVCVPTSRSYGRG